MAKLFYRYGAMNSGKSTALLQVAHNYEERGMNVLVVKALIDTKGENKIVTRIGLNRRADILLSKSANVFEEVMNRSNKSIETSCVLVDEAQFLSEKQIDQLLDLTVKNNIPVICYGLRTDFQRKLFPASKRLFALAHEIEELRTICRCGKKAIFNGRKIDGDFVFEGTQVAIDGEAEVTYESLCGKCYEKESSE